MFFFLLNLQVIQHRHQLIQLKPINHSIIKIQMRDKLHRITTVKMPLHHRHRNQHKNHSPMDGALDKIEMKFKWMHNMTIKIFDTVLRLITLRNSINIIFDTVKWQISNNANNKIKTLLIKNTIVWNSNSNNSNSIFGQLKIAFGIYDITVITV